MDGLALHPGGQFYDTRLKSPSSDLDLKFYDNINLHFTSLCKVVFLPLVPFPQLGDWLEIGCHHLLFVY